MRHLPAHLQKHRAALLSVWLGLCMVATPLRAELHPASLSDAEVEQIRECRYIPTDCVHLYVKFLDLRAQQIHDLYAKPRRPGREEDTHDLIEQFTAIADELDDNLEDYANRHADIRKALPKLADATERWTTTIKSPPDNEAYSVSRKIALESTRDLHAAALKLIDEQTEWFKAHPPPKPVDRQSESIDLPR